MKSFGICVLAATLGSTGVALTTSECAALGLDASGNPLKTGPSPTSGSDAGPFPPALSNNGMVTAQAQSPQPAPAPVPARAQSTPVAPPAALPATPAPPAATAPVDAATPAISPTRQWIIEQELDRAERDARKAKEQADAASGTPSRAR